MNKICEVSEIKPAGDICRPFSFSFSIYLYPFKKANKYISPSFLGPVVK